MDKSHKTMNETDDILLASVQRSLQELLMSPDEATSFFHKKMILFPFATRADLIAGVRLAVENYFQIELVSKTWDETK